MHAKQAVAGKVVPAQAQSRPAGTDGAKASNYFEAHVRSTQCREPHWHGWFRRIKAS